jgi:hypothetical protein
MVEGMEERSEEYERFEDLARRLVGVPKEEVDEPEKKQGSHA